MIAVDTSSFVAYLQGDQGKDADEVEKAFGRQTTCFPARCSHRNS